MNDLRTKAIPCLLVLTLLISMFASVALVRADQSSEPLRPHGTIVANSDEDLEALRSNDDITGSGTADDPYIIDNYEINATGGSNAIFIGNSSSYIVIRDCWLYGASVSDWQYRFGAGIELYNSSNVTIESNNCTGNQNGIVLRSSTNDLVNNNTLTGNQNGILLYTNSSNNVVVDNYCQGSSYGIWLYTTCTNNTVSENQCLNNTAMGIFLLYGSKKNTVTENTCSGGTYGIFLLQSGDCDIRRNDCTGSSLGIYLQESPDCVVNDNTVTNVNDLGIYMVLSGNSVVKNNNCTDNDIGVYMANLSNVTVENNNCSDNLVFGIYLYSSNYVTIKNNAIDRNDNNGIYLHSSSEVLIENNTIRDNSYQGIYGYEVHNLTILNNAIDGNRDGLYMQTSTIIQVENNILSNNLANGLSEYSSSNVTIVNNTIAHNANFGMYLGESSSILIEDNLIDRNTRYGIFLYSSSGNDFCGNAFLNNNGASSSYSSLHRQVYDSGSNRWNSSSEGNYWSDWSTPDGNGDGLVDSPYLIDGAGNQDFRPIALGINITSYSGAYVSSSTVGVIGTAIGPVGALVKWHNNATNSFGTCAGYEEWTASIPLIDGLNEIVVTIDDGAGNAASANLTVVRDAAAPSITITSPSNGSFLNDSRVEVTWQSDDSGSGIVSYAIQVDGGTAIALPSGASSYAIEGLEDGTHSVRVVATDFAGNVRKVSVSFTIDTIAPTVMIYPTGQEVDVTTTVVMEFSEPMDPSSVLVFISGVTSTYSWNGNALEVVPSSLQYNQEYNVILVGRDLAGNVVSTSWTFRTAVVGYIEGSVVNEEGEAIANATVTLSNGLMTKTDEFGRFEFENVSVGSYFATVVKDGYEMGTVDVTVKANETTDLTTMIAESVVSATPPDFTPLIVGTALGIVAVLSIAFVVYRRRQ